VGRVLVVPVLVAVQDGDVHIALAVEEGPGVETVTPEPGGYATAPAATSQDERPALPKRNKQTHLAPQLREIPQPAQRSSDAGHDPNLMKAFQQGLYEADLHHDDPQRPNSGGSLSPYSNKEA
jgi:hypothetical protein